MSSTVRRPSFYFSRRDAAYGKKGALGHDAGDDDANDDVSDDKNDKREEKDDNDKNKTTNSINHNFKTAASLSKLNVKTGSKWVHTLSGADIYGRTLRTYT